MGKPGSTPEERSRPDRKSVRVRGLAFMVSLFLLFSVQAGDAYAEDSFGEEETGTDFPLGEDVRQEDSIPAGWIQEILESRELLESLDVLDNLELFDDPNVFSPHDF